MKMTKAERLIQQARKRAEAANKPAESPRQQTVQPTNRPKIELAPVPVLEWHGCYDVGWKDLITPESFAHPAKAGRELLQKIFNHLESIGALKYGSIVLDPFNGVGTTAIIGTYRGYRCIGCELEPKFVALTESNFEKNKFKWEAMGSPLPYVVQGDSRNLRQHIQPAVDAVISSPPYTSEIKILSSAFKPVDGSFNSKHFGPDDVGYGNEEGNLGEMEAGSVDAVVTSPPYAELGANIKGHGIVGAGVTSDPKYGSAEYGESPGQLGQMKEADGVDAVVSSPPYVHGLGKDVTYADDEKVKAAAERDIVQKCGGGSEKRYGTSDGQLGQMDEGSVDAVVSSPPYAEIATGAGGLNTKPPQHEGQQTGRTASASQTSDNRYGDNPGQMAKLPAGEVDAIVSSPPYSETILNDDQRQAGKGEKLRWGTNEEYGTSPGQLGTLKEHAGVDAVISSPPYADGGVHGTSNAIDDDEQQRATRAMGNPLGVSSVTGYGTSEGQLGSKDPGAVDAVVSSPPFGTGDSASAQSITERTDKSAEWIKANCGSAATEGYGTSPGQMAQMSMEQETFWTAARDIVRECYAVLKPGGRACWIVKAFVKDKQIVDFPADWRKLCEYCGFTTELEVHAMLVKSGAYDGKVGLHGEVLEEKKERKSFFRRLAESKGSPRIDFEVVYVMRKPNA